MECTKCGATITKGTMHFGGRGPYCDGCEEEYQKAVDQFATEW